MNDDPTLDSWAMDFRKDRQEIDTAVVLDGLAPGSNKIMPGWGGLRAESLNNQTGSVCFEIFMRPVLLGRAECRIALVTQPIGKRPHSKKATVYLTPEAMRGLAEQLLVCAREAERFKVKPKPV